MNENEMKSLENRLSLLRPRRPSGWLKYRIFGARALQVPRLARLAGWATPVTACAVLTFLILDSASPIPIGVSTGSSTLAMLSNVQYAVIETSQQSAQNNLTSYTFDWTNHGFFNSNMRSFSHSN
jgi:hypothetical protein